MHSVSLNGASVRQFARSGVHASAYGMHFRRHRRFGRLNQRVISTEASNLNAPHGAPAHAGGASVERAAQVAFFSSITSFAVSLAACLDIYPRRVKCASFCTQPAANAFFFINEYYPVFADFHRLAFFRAGVKARVIRTVMAAMDRMIHSPDVFFHKYPVV
jgi:hypothetical protein